MTSGFVVLDKSYLQGCSSVDIGNILQRYRIVMPEVLFMEIMTTQCDGIKKCFKKIPDVENPVDLLPNVGTLMRYEIENKEPCTPIEKQFLNNNLRYKFNDRLASGKFKFVPEDKELLNNWLEITTNDTEDYIERSIIIDHWFPELIDYKTNNSPKIIYKLMNDIATKTHLIRDIYSQIRTQIYHYYGELWPDPNSINKKWILFRYLQGHLIAAIEYIRKFGKNSKTVTKRLENEYLDIQYYITASVCDGLATRDKKIQKFYSLLCPDKKLIK